VPLRFCRQGKAVLAGIFVNIESLRRRHEPGVGTDHVAPRQLIVVVPQDSLEREPAHPETEPPIFSSRSRAARLSVRGSVRPLVANSSATSSNPASFGDEPAASPRRRSGSWGAPPFKYKKTAGEPSCRRLPSPKQLIRIWMRTAVQQRVSSPAPFLSTLRHEFCHHL
jgi:hypothetical protein